MLYNVQRVLTEALLVYKDNIEKDIKDYIIDLRNLGPEMDDNEKLRIYHAICHGEQYIEYADDLFAKIVNTDMFNVFNKSIPLKPVIEGACDSFMCPECKEFVGTDCPYEDKRYQKSYCENCGQAIDWSDEKW